MGRVSDVLLALTFLSVFTPCPCLPFWLRLPQTRKTSGAGIGLKHPTDGMRPRPRPDSSFLKRVIIPKKMSGRNKLFFDHLKMSLDRGNEGGYSRGHSPLAINRTPKQQRRHGTYSPRRKVGDIRRTGFQMPSIGGLNTYSSHQRHKPFSSTQLKRFLTRFGFSSKSRVGSSLPVMLPRLGGHGKRGRTTISPVREYLSGNTKLDEPSVISDVSISHGINNGGTLSRRRNDKHSRYHSAISDSYDRVLSHKEYMAKYPFIHVVPCDPANRYYCLNGGTCVFVDALDITTCRCPLGYTGKRCEMVDQEYIFNLISNFERNT